MFCNQCEQTFQGQGCTRMGVCGKTAEVAGIQDLIVYAATPGVKPISTAEEDLKRILA